MPSVDTVSTARLSLAGEAENIAIVNTRGDLIRNVMVSLAIIVVVPALAYVALSYGQLALLGLIGLLGVIVAVYVGMRHPLWLFWGLALVVGALPFGQFPGVNLPLYLPLAFGALVAVYVHPRLARSIHPIEIAVWALLVTSVISVLVTSHTLISVIMIVRWGIVTLVAIALIQLSNEHLAKFGRIFVYGSLFNALFGLYMVAFDPAQTAFRYLRVFGYAAELTAPRFAYSQGGSTQLIRLGGTSVDPNGEGIALVVALAVALIVFAGWRRVVFSAIIGVALILTLSRASIFSVVVGVILVLIFHRMRTRDRLLGLGGLAALVVVGFLTPSIRTRFLSAFADDDRGANDRIESLRDFPRQMAGHWWFGLGWDRPEFTDGNYAFLLNHVSNAPLLTIYRGGIFAGLAFVAVMVVGCVYSYRAMRSNSFAFALYGGIFIGFCLVALQLDHPVGGSPPSVMKFAIFLAFLVYMDRTRNEPLRHVPSGPREKALTTAN